MLKQNLEQIFSVIGGGNNLGEKITLVGASKTMPVETINQAIALGLKVVAENRVQEFNAKHGLIQGAEEQFIGHLQTNKVKYLVGKVSLIQSVDSIHLAEEINRQALKKGVVQEILVEVNVGGELSKSGFNPNNAEDCTKFIKENLLGVKVVGLMAMLPRSEDNGYLASLTRKMRSLYDLLKDKGFEFKHLSVGMSGDYKIAIQNGSNMIRLGRTIFGERKKEEKDNGCI